MTKSLTRLYDVIDPDGKSCLYAWHSGSQMLTNETYYCRVGLFTEEQLVEYFNFYWPCQILEVVEV